MGRKSIPIKLIEHEKNRLVTFAKRKTGLFKKAYELSVLCGCEVLVIVFTPSNRLYQYATHDVEKVLKRHRDHPHAREFLNNSEMERLTNQRLKSNRHKPPCGSVDASEDFTNEDEDEDANSDDCDMESPMNDPNHNPYQGQTIMPDKFRGPNKPISDNLPTLDLPKPVQPSRIYQRQRSMSETAISDQTWFGHTDLLEPKRFENLHQLQPLRMSNQHCNTGSIAPVPSNPAMPSLTPAHADNFSVAHQQQQQQLQANNVTSLNLDIDHGNNISLTYVNPIGFSLPVQHTNHPNESAELLNPVLFTSTAVTTQLNSNITTSSSSTSNDIAHEPGIAKSITNRNLSNCSPTPSYMPCALLTNIPISPGCRTDQSISFLVPFIPHQSHESACPTFADLSNTTSTNSNLAKDKVQTEMFNMFGDEMGEYTGDVSDPTLDRQSELGHLETLTNLNPINIDPTSAAKSAYSSNNLGYSSEGDPNTSNSFVKHEIVELNPVSVSGLSQSDPFRQTANSTSINLVQSSLTDPVTQSNFFQPTPNTTATDELLHLKTALGSESVGPTQSVPTEKAIDLSSTPPTVDNHGPERTRTSKLSTTLTPLSFTKTHLTNHSEGKWPFLSTPEINQVLSQVEGRPLKRDPSNCNSPLPSVISNDTNPLSLNLPRHKPLHSSSYLSSKLETPDPPVVSQGGASSHISPFEAHCASNQSQSDETNVLPKYAKRSKYP